MKILQFICHLDIGGAETLVKDLSLRMKAQGHDVVVLLLDPLRQTVHAQTAQRSLTERGIEVLSLERQPGTAPLGAVRSLAALLRERRFDVIHSHLPFPDLVATLALTFSGMQARHVSTIHNSNIASDGWLWHRTLRFRNSVFCSHAAAAANPASRTKGVIRNGSALSTAKPSSAEADDALRLRIRTELGLATEDRLIISVGRITQQKNQQLLVRSLATLQRTFAQPFQCFMVGSVDPNQEDVRALTRDAGLEERVHLAGPRSDVSDLLRAADIFVSTSLWEGLPVAVLEALFSGIPCVLSPLPEHLEIGRSVPGVFFPTDMEPESFAVSLQQALMESSTHDDLRKARQSSMQPYTIEACADAYLNLYQTQHREA